MPTKIKAKPAKPVTKKVAAKKAPVKKTVAVSGKSRYHEPAPKGIDLESFRKVVISRRSVRKFTDKPIPKAVLDDCLDMAMLAPCSSGLQPWEFYVVKSADKKARLVKACMSQLAAKTAQELIVCVARTDRIGEFSKKMLRDWPMPDVPMVVRRFDEVRVKKLLQLSDAAFPIMVVGAGERADDGVFWPQLRFERELFVREV